MDELHGLEALGENLDEAVVSTTRAIVADLEPSAIEAFYRCTVLHWFDVPTIAAVLATGSTDHRGEPYSPSPVSAGMLYEELRRLPFVETYDAERLNVHELTRTAMAAALWHEQPLYYREVSAIAAGYFRDRVESEDQVDEDIVELAYHQLVADEADGTALVLGAYDAGLGQTMVLALADAVKEHLNAGRLPESASYLVPVGQLLVALENADLSGMAAMGEAVQADSNAPDEVREWATLQFARSKRLSGDYGTSFDLLIPLWEAGRTPAHRATAASYLAEHALDQGKLDETRSWAEKALTVAVQDALVDADDPGSEPRFQSAIRPQLLDATAWWPTSDLFAELMGISRDQLLSVGEEEPSDGGFQDTDEFVEEQPFSLSEASFALLQESRDRPTTRLRRWVRRRLGGIDQGATGDAEQTWAVFDTDPLMATIWMTLAEVHRRRGEYADALAAAQLAGRMSELQGDFQGVMDAAAAQERLGYSVADSGLAEASMDILKLLVYEAREAGSREAELAALIQLGASHQAREHFADAREALSEAINLAAELGDRLSAASIHERLADIDTATSSWASASDHVGRATDLYREADFAQGLAWTQVTKGDLERLRGRVDDAADAYREALDRARSAKLTDVERTALRGLGQTAVATGELEKASSYFEQAVRLTGAGPAEVVDALRDLADVRERLGDAASAQRYLDRAAHLVRQFDLHSKSADVAMSEGDQARAQKDWERALEEYATAEGLFAEHSSPSGVALAVLSQAATYAQMDRYKEAIDGARRALAISREHNNRMVEILALQSLSEHLTYEGSVAEAIDTAREAVALDPENAESHGTLGNALLQDKQFEASIAASKTAIALDHTQQWAVSNLGHAFLGAGQPDQAEPYFRRAIEHVRPDDDFLEDIKDIKMLLAHNPDLPRAREFLTMFEEAQATKTADKPPTP